MTGTWGSLRMPAAGALPFAGCAGPGCPGKDPAGPACCPRLESVEGQGAPPSWGRGFEGVTCSREGCQQPPLAGTARLLPGTSGPQQSPPYRTWSQPIVGGSGWGCEPPAPAVPCPLPGDPWGCLGLSWGQPMGPGPRISLAPLSVAPTGDFGPRSGASIGPPRWFSWGPCFGFSSSLDTEPTVCVGAGVPSSKDSHCLAGGGARGCLPGRVECSDVSLAWMHPQGQTPPTPESPTSGGESAGSPHPHARLCEEPPFLPAQGGLTASCLGGTASFFLPSSLPLSDGDCQPCQGPVASDCHPLPCPGTRDLAFTPWSSRMSQLRAVPPPRRRARPSPGRGLRCGLWPDLASEIQGVSYTSTPVNSECFSGVSVFREHLGHA